jgi:hypothetical protein
MRGAEPVRPAKEIRMSRKIASAMVLLAAVPGTMFADFQCQEKTQITGGAVVGMMKMAGAISSQARQANEPLETTILVKGNRMARINRLHSEIVDLDRETITNIDHAKKQYTVVTFEQMKQQMQEAVRKAKAEQQKGQANTPSDNTELSFDVKVRDTGASKNVAGVDAKEAILTMMMQGRDKATGETGALAMTDDMWMVPDIPGYVEYRDFQMRFAQKMGQVIAGAGMSPQLMAMHPGLGQGMAQMTGEMSKLHGVPVLQVLRVGTTANGQPLPAASEAPLPASPATPNLKDAAQTATENAANTAATDAQESAAAKVASKMGSFGNVATGLGGFGGFGRKKKQKQDSAENQPQPGNPQANAPNQGAAVLMESQTEMTSFSTAPIAADRVAVPTGYQQVQPQSIRD